MTLTLQRHHGLLSLNAAKLIVCYCTYNRSARLPALISALRQQDCAVPFEMLVVNNNSTDDTPRTLARLAAEPGPRLRVVQEATQGISPARNRAVAEAQGAAYLIFLDDDELRRPGFVAAAYRALSEQGADCVGGRVHISFQEVRRPRWLSDDLLGHLAKLDYGEDPFWITDPKQPVWTANCGYRLAIFADRELRLDKRYSRVGQSVGGGSDEIMFRLLLEKGAKIRYDPDMEVDHFVESWRLRRAYLLRLHFVNGRRFGQHGMPDYPKSMLGIPPFLLRETLERWIAVVGLWMTRKPDAFRTTLDGVHRLGCIWGRILRWKEMRRIQSATDRA